MNGSRATALSDSRAADRGSEPIDMRPKTFINAAPTIHVDAPPVRYTLALGAAAAAVLVRAALSPLLGSWQPFLTIYPAVLLVALRCGWRPASATLAVSLPLCVALFQRL